jgi:hypothetical protein
MPVTAAAAAAPAGVDRAPGIEMLMTMGATEEQASTALEAADGDMDRAANMIFSWWCEGVDVLLRNRKARRAVFVCYSRTCVTLLISMDPFLPQGILKGKEFWCTLTHSALGKEFSERPEYFFAKVSLFREERRRLSIDLRHRQFAALIR